MTITKNKHTFEFINEPEEVLVEDNDNKNMHAPNVNEHDVNKRLQR